MSIYKNRNIEDILRKNVAVFTAQEKELAAVLSDEYVNGKQMDFGTQKGKFSLEFSKAMERNTASKLFKTVMFAHLNIDENIKLSKNQLVEQINANKKAKSLLKSYVEIVISAPEYTPRLDGIERFVNYQTVEIAEDEYITVNVNSRILAKQITGFTWDVDRDKVAGKRKFKVDMLWYHAKAYAEFIDLLLGRTTVAELRVKVEKALERNRTNLISQAFYTYNGIIGSQGGDFYGTGTDPMALIELADKLAEYTGQETVLIGTLSTLRQVAISLGDVSGSNFTGVNLLSNDMKNDINMLGTIGTIQGHETIVIPAPKDDDGKLIAGGSGEILIKAVDEDEPFIHVLTGAMKLERTRDYTDTTDMTTDVDIQECVGISITSVSTDGLYIWG